MICLLLAGVVIGLFWQIHRYDFIFYDDDLYVTENVHVQRGLNVKNLAWAFTSTDAGFWHPLTWLSLMLDYQLYRLNAGGYHWTNVLLHMISTVLIFLVFRRMTRAVGMSALVAALFALHPLHVESVAWVSQRKDVLSAVFWLLTMLMYVRYAERPGTFRYSLVVLFFMFGLMSKPMVVTLPVVLLLMDYWPLGRFPARFYHGIGVKHFKEASLAGLVGEKLPLFVVAAGVTVLTFYTEGKIGALKSVEMFPLDARAANAIVSYGVYIRQTFWPENLAILYPHSGMPPCWQVTLSGLILLLITALVLYYVRRCPFPAIGWLWYIVTLAPVIGLVQVGSHAHADRYTYIPLIGLFMVAVWGSSHLLRGFKYERILLMAIWGVVLSFLAVVSWHQLQYWRDSVPLLQHTIRVTDRNYVMYNNLGVALFQQGKLDEAAASFEKVLQIKPDYADALSNMGLVTAFRGEADQAKFYYMKALTVKKDNEKAHNNLANLYADQGKLSEAVDHYREALKLNPDNADVYNNLGMALMRQNRLEEALGSFEEALKIKPGHTEARSNMNNTLRKMGNNVPLR